MIKRVKMCPNHVQFEGKCPVYLECKLKGFTWNCQIIPPKAKPKMVRVKAWARYAELTKTWWADTANVGKGIPCTILIDRKWLKGDKA